jgi:transcription elongation factor GreA
MKKLHPPLPPKIPFTQEGYDKVLAEKAKLLSERPAAVDHLKKSREMGDLSENGYYHASKSRLTSLDSRLRHLDRLIRSAVIVASTGRGVVEIGSSIVISNGTREFDYSIVGGYESNPMQKTISHLSPLGKALMGKRVGDEVEVIAPKGTTKYKILKIS